MIKLFFTQVGISASSKVMGCVAPGCGLSVMRHRPGPACLCASLPCATGNL